jgi:hypothetical protein
LKYENLTAGFRARFQFLACQAETRDHLIMPAQAYTLNSGLTILGKGLDAGATFDGDVAKGIGQLKAGQLMKYVVNDARQERHLHKDDGSAPFGLPAFDVDGMITSETAMVYRRGVFDRQEVETANGFQIEPSDPIDTLLRDLGITLANLQLWLQSGLGLARRIVEVRPGAGCPL